MGRPGRLEKVAKAAGGGYCRLQLPLQLALGVRETVAGHRLGAGVTSSPSNVSLHAPCVGPVGLRCARAPHRAPDQAGFVALDDDDSGLLSKEELFNGFRKWLGPKLSALVKDDEMKSLWKQSDEDSSGYLKFWEFSQLLRAVLSAALWRSQSMMDGDVEMEGDDSGGSPRNSPTPSDLPQRSSSSSSPSGPRPLPSLTPTPPASS